MTVALDSGGKSLWSLIEINSQNLCYLKLEVSVLSICNWDLDEQLERPAGDH